MFKRILVPLDSSPLAERAIPVAARIARATGAEVVLFQAVMLPTYGYGPYFILTPVTAPEYRLETDVANATAYLQRIAASSELVGIKTTMKVQIGTAATTILATAQARAVDLIVLCSRGQTGLKRWMLGSIAQKVARQSSIPVLVLRDDEISRPGAVGVRQHSSSEQPRRVLVPLDGSALAIAAVVPAAQLASALAAPGEGALHLTSVVKRDTLPREGNLDEPTKEVLLHRAKQYLTEVAEHLRAGIAGTLKLTVTWSVVLDTDVASALVTIAEDGAEREGSGVFGGCDLIAMSTHGRGGLQHWALGSITERVLDSTKLPVLIVRPAHRENTAITSENEGEAVTV